MKKRWICLFVENEIGVLARITGFLTAGGDFLCSNCQESTL